MKKSILFLILPIFMILTIQLAMATSCTPDEGYNKCWENSNTYGSATAYVKIQINNVMQGVQKGGYYIDEAYIPIEYICDKAYWAENVGSWDNLWDNIAKCDKNGCQGNLVEGSGSNVIITGKLIVADTDPSTTDTPNFYKDCPIFYAWDYTKAPNGDWSWKSTGYGWAKSGNCFDVKVVDCYDEADCSGGEYCDKTGSWETWTCKIKECTENIDCGFPEGIGDAYCRGNEVIIQHSTPTCSDYKCTTEMTEEVVQICDIGCENGQCTEEQIIPEFDYNMLLILLFVIFVIYYFLKRKKR